MRKRRKPGYATLMTFTILMVLGAILTVMPMPSAYRECMLGYKAHCTLAPISTVSCVIVAGMACVVQKRLFTERAQEELPS
jgi:hypothetical protein